MGRNYSTLLEHRAMICRDIGWMDNRMGTLLEELDAHSKLTCHESCDTGRTSTDYNDVYQTVYPPRYTFSFEQEVLERSMLERESETLVDRVTMSGQDLDEYKFDGSNVKLEDGETRITLMTIDDSLLMKRRNSEIKKNV